MKKRMFLTTVLMTLVLLLAVTTATFAWYQATAASTNYGQDSSDQITAATSTASLGDFTITPEFVSLGNMPSLSDNSGKTYVIVNGEEVLATPTSGLTATATVKLVVTYSGTLKDAAQINAAWQEVAKAVTITITDATVGAPANGGLKFFEAAPTSDYTGLNTVTLPFTLAEMQALVFSVSGEVVNAPETSVHNLIYGIRGVNDTTADASTKYVIKAVAAAK